MKRFDKIVEQFDINKDDIGLGVDGHESQSDDE